MRIFNKLNDISHDLVHKNHYTVSYSFVIFNKILKIYIELLDVPRFMDVILNENSMPNDTFLRQLVRITEKYDFERWINQMKMKSRREIFIFFFDQLSVSKLLISYIQNSITKNSDDQNNLHHHLISNSCCSILYLIFKVLNYIRIKLIANDLEKYQNTLLSLFIKYINQHFFAKEHVRINENQNTTLVIEMLYFISNITDKTLIIPIMISLNLPQLCLQWLSLTYLKFYEYKFILNVLNNIARHDDGIRILKQYNCSTILRRFKDEILYFHIGFVVDKPVRLAIFRLMDSIRLLITDPLELYIVETNEPTISIMLSTIEHCLALANFRYHGFHLSELLITVMKLSVHDNILDYILQNNRFLLVSAAILGILLSNIEHKTIESDNIDLDVLSILALGNILWSISFHEKYKIELIKNTDLIKSLETFRTSETTNHVLPYIYLPQQMSSLKRVIDGISQNLFPSSPPMLNNQLNPAGKLNCSLMISYSHCNINIAKHLNELLMTIPQLLINVDFHNGKYLWKETIEMMEQSDVVLFILSKEFFYDKACRQELIYVTDRLKKLFFPIFIDENFKPTGWLHTRVARLKTIYFNEINPIQTLEEILNMINEHLCMNLSLVRNSDDMKRWDKDEVQKWFVDKHIVPELYEFYQFENGNELWLYAQAILKYSYIDEYQRIKRRFDEKFHDNQKDLSEDEFQHFINELKDLERQTYSN